MHRRSWPAVAGLAAGLAALAAWPPAALLAQPAVPGPVPAAAADALSAAQLDRLTAPIALYSDPLAAQILIAATYPLQIVEAHRWLLDPAHASLHGAALLAALQPQPWDLSVKSLVPFAQVLQMMDDNLQWTERIGEAFLTQQGALMDSIQRLRQRAAAAGTLVSTPQQNISTLDQSILIDPASADEVYVPYYDPVGAYGPWPWPDDPPYELAPPAGIDLSGATSLVFGPGVIVIAPLWGWQRWHWRRHALEVAIGGQPGQMRSWRYSRRNAMRRGAPGHGTLDHGEPAYGTPAALSSGAGSTPDAAAAPQIPHEQVRVRSGGSSRSANGDGGRSSAPASESAPDYPPAPPAAPPIHIR